jgi:hypothetical protein
MDEVGVSEWKDDKPNKVVLPASMGGHSTHQGVNRNLKHVPIIPASQQVSNTLFCL